jgi:hypothetical protein
MSLDPTAAELLSMLDAMWPDVANMPPAQARDQVRALSMAAEPNPEAVAGMIRRYDGVFHGFFSMATTLPIAEQAQRDAFTTLRDVLASVPNRAA